MEKPDLDQTLLLEAAKGNREAFDQFQSWLEPSIRRFVYRMIGSCHDVDDIVQEVFVALLHNLHRIVPIENARAYAYGVARNFCYQRLRDQRRDAWIELDDDFAAAEDDWRFAAAPQEDTLDWRNLYAEVQRAIDRLPSAQKQILLLYFEEEMTYPEIAQVLNVSLGTVKSRLFYAKRALKGVLKPSTLMALTLAFRQDW